jgi:hypothetical protein
MVTSDLVVGYAAISREAPIVFAVIAGNQRFPDPADVDRGCSELTPWLNL